MLIWVCALHCEAKPVIDRYRLKKSHADHPFDLYQGEDTICVVSGIGKIASSAASSWAGARFQEDTSLAWINLGTAGAAEHPLGSAFSLHQVIDADDDRRYYPAPAAGEHLPGSACMTLSQPCEDYSETCLFDMEASGFMFAALRFSSSELVRSLKIVSDNRHSRTGRNRRRISELIQANIAVIDSEAEALSALNREHSARIPDRAGWQDLLRLARFSQTQQNRLRVLWRYLANRNHDLENLLQQLHGLPASAIIEQLEQLGYRDSETL